MEKTGAAPGAEGRHASPDGFSLDINALRALSVIAVVGFHFQIPGFAGGFVGVDVFLVTTGGPGSGWSMAVPAMAAVREHGVRVVHRRVETPPMQNVQD